MAELLLAPELLEIPELDISHLVTEDDTPVGNIFSEKQQRLSTHTLYLPRQGPQASGRPLVALANVGLFYAWDQPAVVPDVLVSLDVWLPEEVWEKRHRSYFIWEYGKPPEVVIEIVSNRKGEELGAKRRLYARIGVAYYVVFDPQRLLSQDKLRIYELRGTEYALRRQRWLPGVGLGLTLWEGEFEGLPAVWLRWCDKDGRLLLTGAEMAQEEREQADEERQRAERLAAQLRAMGIEPEV
ncbi:MAG: Uma2 family endonuclease [Chloroflexota bacterium]